MRTLIRASGLAVSRGDVRRAHGLAGRAVALLDPGVPASTTAAARECHASTSILAGQHRAAREFFATFAVPDPSGISAADIHDMRHPSIVQSLLRLGLLDVAEQLIAALLAV